MKENNTFYSTTSIAYVNSEPHIGFLFELTATDVLTRTARLLGRETFFLTGTDEHGEKIARKSKEVGVKPQEYVDRISNHFRALGEDFDISFDYFVRTTDLEHKKFVTDAWNELIKNGYLEKRNYSGLYCVGCESFKTERELTDGLCPIHLTEVERIEEENWFFLLSKFQGKVSQWLDTSPVYPVGRLNEAKEVVRSGLEDISFSRSKSKLEWGIPVPNDSTQVMYVWADALLNYLSALETCAKQSFWPASIQVVGKDIARFHAIIWPALLSALNKEMPQKLLVHGFILVDGNKMSKSLGNVVTPDQLRNRYAKDGTRYLLLRLLNFYEDSNFVWHDADSLYNGELANGLGNLVSRSITLLKNFQDKIGSEQLQKIFLNEKNKQQKEAETLLLDALLTKNDFQQYLFTINQTIKKSDGYISENRPWEWAKKNQITEKSVVDFVSQVPLFYLETAIRPLMPETADKIKQSLLELKSVLLFPKIS